MTSAPNVARDGVSRQRAIETARNRLLATGVLFLLAFVVMAGRLVDLTAFDQSEHRKVAYAQPILNTGRGDIVDRNGNILATSLPTASVYADPKLVLDADAAVADLARVFPDLDRDVIRARLNSQSRFVWIKRGLTPDQEDRVNRLGIPGVGFVAERRRVYPHRRAAAHVLGFTDVDGRGIAGVEQHFNNELSHGQKVVLSLDVRIQDLMRRELEQARAEFRAVGAAGLVVDANTGEVLALVSLPDYDPNVPVLDPDDDARFNRVTTGVYEMGSTFKLFTLATALDTGTTTLSRGYDASHPLHVSRFTISDYHAKNRWLSSEDILVYSSNVGAALMAMDFGTALQKQYLSQLGLLTKARIELPEVGAPLIPSPWREINTMTVSYGHGIAVTPLQLVNAVTTVVNGGYVRPATLEYRDEPARDAKQVLSLKTSRLMRYLMRQVVLRGTGSKADVPGYKVGGKTGTAEKLVHGHYLQNARISSFVGAFPIDSPRYVILAMLDEPKGNRLTANYATGGWVAAPVVADMVQQMAPMVGIPPVPDDELPGSVRRAEKPATQPKNATNAEKPAMLARRSPHHGGRERQLVAETE